MITTPVTEALTALSIPHRLFTHPGEVTSLEQAAEERGHRPSQVVRSLLFRLGKGDYVMLLVAGPEQVSWPALRQYLGQSRLTTASREEVLQVTGYPIGGVSPFGLPAPIRILVDESVLAETELSIGAGVRGSTVILKSDDLMRGLEGAEVGAFKEEK
jgi:Cys-tRNA(Pro) deacylase